MLRRFAVLRRPHRLAALTAVCLAASSPAFAATATLAEGDNINVQVSNNTATLQITLNKAPPASQNATLKAMMRDYAYWSVPVNLQGMRVSASLNADQIEALLAAERLVIDFPAAGSGEALQIVVPRDRYLPAFEPAASLVRGDPLFFDAPEAPPPLEVPDTNVERVRAESYAMQARLRERELLAHMHQFASARARAHALFLDLRTAGRLPWSQDVLNQLEQNYEKLRQREQEIDRSREQLRNQARQFVQQWNAAHSGQTPIELTFGDAS